MDKKYKEEYLYKDVYTIIEMMDRDSVDKIDPQFIQFLKENMDDNYESTVNPFLPLKDQDLRPELRLMISLMYINYFCDVDQKEDFLKFDKVLIDEYNLKIKEVFYNKSQNDENKTSENFNNKLDVNKKENLLNKILNKIKSIFKKK